MALLSSTKTTPLKNSIVDYIILRRFQLRKSVAVMNTEEEPPTDIKLHYFKQEVGSVTKHHKIHAIKYYRNKTIKHHWQVKV